MWIVPKTLSAFVPDMEALRKVYFNVDKCKPFGIIRVFPKGVL